MKSLASLLVAVTLLLFTISCDVFEGPVGPEGPQGAIGDSGPGTRTVYSGQFDTTGQVEITLPPEAGDMSDPPVIGVYISPDGISWGAVAIDFVWDGGLLTMSWVSVREDEASRSLIVFITGVNDNYKNWFYRIVVVR